MNTDQLINLVQTLLKLAAGALTAKGIGDSSLWEGVSGAVLAAVTWYASHKWNATAASSPTPVITPQPPTATAGLVRQGVLFVLAMFSIGLAVMIGCGTPKLEVGGAYAPAVTNSAGELVPTAQPDLGLFITDSSYKLAYETIDAVLKFERDNRAQLQAISPKIKTSLDAIRPKVWEIDQRWARARQAYKANPIPANLDAMQQILAEIQTLVPTVQALLQTPAS